MRQLAAPVRQLEASRNEVLARVPPVRLQGPTGEMHPMLAQFTVSVPDIPRAQDITG